MDDGGKAAGLGSRPFSCKGYLYRNVCFVGSPCIKGYDTGRCCHRGGTDKNYGALPLAKYGVEPLKHHYSCQTRREGQECEEDKSFGKCKPAVKLVI